MQNCVCGMEQPLLSWLLMSRVRQTPRIENLKFARALTEYWLMKLVSLQKILFLIRIFLLSRQALKSIIITQLISSRPLRESAQSFPVHMFRVACRIFLFHSVAMMRFEKRCILLFFTTPFIPAWIWAL